MCLLTRSRLALFLSVSCVVLFAQNAANAQQRQLSITAMNDKPSGPSGVKIVVDALDSNGGSLFTTNLFWNGDDNSFSTQSVSIPLATQTLRFTFRDDCCGSNGPGDCTPSCTVCDATNDPDCDRNAFIDSFSLDGCLRQGEDFDRTGAPGKSCSSALRGGRMVASCGEEGAFVEYDIVPQPGQLSITAMNDKPAGPSGVKIVVDALDSNGGSLFTTNLFWNGDDNTYSAQSVTIPLAKRLATRSLRFTFRDDCCGSNGPGDCTSSCTVCDAANDPDCDRNAFIDSFSLDGCFREGETFDRTGDPGTNCFSALRGGRMAAVCGQEGGFVEYDVPPAPPVIPAVSEWGLVVLALLVLTAGTIIIGRRRRNRATEIA